MIFEKQKYTTEIIPLTVDFTAALPTGETVGATSTVTAATNATPPVDATTALLTGQTNTTVLLTATVKASAIGTWMLTYTAITSPGGFKIVEYLQLTVI
jgi:hypothetical protein